MASYTDHLRRENRSEQWIACIQSNDYVNPLDATSIDVALADVSDGLITLDIATFPVMADAGGRPASVIETNLMRLDGVPVAGLSRPFLVKPTELSPSTASPKDPHGRAASLDGITPTSSPRPDLPRIIVNRYDTRDVLPSDATGPVSASPRADRLTFDGRILRHVGRLRAVTDFAETGESYTGWEPAPS